MNTKYVTREEIIQAAPREIEKHRAALIALFDELRAAGDVSPAKLSRLIERRTPIRRESII